MKKLNLKLGNNKKGITLIALVITIIVLLILAGVTIATLTGENGILTRATDAKIETALGAVKEALRLEQIEKKIDDEEVNPETLLANGKVQRTVQQGEDGNYYMYYALKENAYEGMQGLGKGNLASLEDVFLIDDDLNIKYISSNGKEYGDNINNKILEDETEIRFASEAFSEYVSKISGVTEEEMKFKWMKEQTSLTIDDASITSLEDLVFFPNLETLILKNLTLDNLNGIENCKKLNNFRAEQGNIKDYFQLSNLQNLKFFTKIGVCDFDNIVDSIKHLELLEQFAISQANLTSMKRVEDLSNNIKYLSLGVNKITKIEGLENKKNLETLILNQNMIKDMNGLQNCTKLKEINLYSNDITKIEGIDKLLNLSNLNLGYNHVEDILPLSANTSLTTLDLRGNTGIDGNRSNYTGEKLEALNKIGEILDRGGTIYLDIDKLGLFTNYKRLDLANQNLTTLEQLEGMTELTYLTLSMNPLTLQDEKSQNILSAMKNLENLNLQYNDLKDISAINKLTNLKVLWLEKSGANLAEIEDIISNLDNIRVSDSEFQSILNCNINKITTLNLQYSIITELVDLSKFTKLTKLSLSAIPNISNFDIVSEITSLKDLNLSGNNLHGRMINFSKLTNLTNLDLSRNTLWSEDLENLKALKNNTNLTINLSNNSIIDASALLELNSNTKINLTKNVNLSQESKQALTAHFGSNVTYDK